MDIILGTSAEDRANVIYERAVALSEDEKKNILIIVPEQYTLETQRGIVKKHPRHAIMNIDVVSFNRLAYKVLDKTGAANLPLIRETGKNMLVRKVLNEHISELKYFTSGIRKKGFISELKSLLSELDQYACEPDAFFSMSEEMKKGGHKKVSDKLRDIALLYENYKRELFERFFTCEDLHSALRLRIAESDVLDGSHVFFDGFTGFTMSQYKIIEALIKKAADTCFSLCYEGDKLHPEDAAYDSGNLFFMTDTCIKKLEALSKSAGKEKISFTFTDESKPKESKRAPELEFLRHSFFINPAALRGMAPPCFKAPVEAIVISEADDIKEEISMVIGKIRRLIAAEGYRYRDIAVVMEDPDRYGDLTLKLMEQNGFPVFLDRTKNVSTNPFAENIRAFLKLISDGFTYENVFRYIKCGFSPVGGEYTDELDNYCLAMGIRKEKDWKKEWIRPHRKKRLNSEGEYEEYYDLKRLNSLRELFYSHFVKYKKALEGTAVVYEKTKLIRLFLDEECVSTGIKALFNSSIEEETRIVLKKTADILKEIDNLFGEKKIDTAEYAEMLDAAFEEMNAGFIPPSNDCIIIGDTDRTRLSLIKALFVLGVNDGYIPKKNSEHGILNDADRLRLSSMGVSLSPSVREQAFIQRYYLYLLLTKPFEKLFLSYSRKDIQGETLKESYLIKEMRYRFKSLKTNTVSSGDLALGSLGLVKADIWTPGKENIILSGDAVDGLYSGVVSGSISSFESFAGCPFTYFLKKGLNIYPRERYEFNPADFGTIVHDILYRVLKKCTDKSISLHKLSVSRLAVLVGEELDAAAKDYYILSDSERNLFIRYRIKQLAAATLKAIGYQLSGGEFVPHSFEKRFKSKREIRGGGLEFSGIIDRSDICISGNELYLRIVDYKTGQRDFDLNKLYNGRQLQLVSYMNAAREELTALYPDKNIIPSALVYMTAKDAFATEDEKRLTDEEITDQINADFRMRGIIADDGLSIIKNDRSAKGDVIAQNKGLVTKEQMDILQDFAALKTEEIAESILSGEASISPLEEPGEQSLRAVCAFCDYKSVCNYTPGLVRERRVMRRCKDAELWEKMKECVE